MTTKKAKTSTKKSEAKKSVKTENSDIKKLLKATGKKNAIAVKKIANKLIKERVMQKIKEKEKEIAKKYFNQD